MKKALIGGFFSIIGSIWTMAILNVAGNNLTSAWTTPPGRLLTTVAEMGMTIWLAIAAVILVFGMAILLKEYFSKQN